MNNLHLSKNRSYRLDILKAIAIFFVVFYHLGFLKNGYLGVDVFFVISGFLMMNSFLKATDSGKFSYIKSTLKKVLRFWPLILIIGLMCLVIGFFTMLPDDFENLGESVVASNLFAANVLSSITTRNYWNISNNYRPLMHLWYISVLIQAYILLPLLFHLFNKIGKRALIASIAALCTLSLVLYFIPLFPDSLKFYHLPFRLFELLFGSIVCFISFKTNHHKLLYALQIVIIALLILIMSFYFPTIPDKILHQQEREAAGLAHLKGEAPDVAETDRGADSSKQEAYVAAP